MKNDGFDRRAFLKGRGGRAAQPPRQSPYPRAAESPAGRARAGKSGLTGTGETLTRI